MCFVCVPRDFGGDHRVTWLLRASAPKQAAPHGMKCVVGREPKLVPYTVKGAARAKIKNRPMKSRESETDRVVCQPFPFGCSDPITVCVKASTVMQT